MTAANEQIVAAFEDNNMSIEEIADDFGYDALAVKAILMQNSVAYRKQMKINPDMNFTEDEAVEMRNIVVSLARYAENQDLQFRCARYILDDLKGRLDMGNQVKNININITNFNEQMKRARAAAERTIDIENKLLPA
mgnify:CR=1 FL=1